MYGGQSTHIPLKVNAAGVIPVIFALSLLMFPMTIASFWQGNALGALDHQQYELRQAARHGACMCC